MESNEQIRTVCFIKAENGDLATVAEDELEVVWI